MIDLSLFEQVVKIRRDLHQHPETGFDVQRTAKIVAEELRQLGLDVKEQVGKTGVVADLNVEGAHKRIAFRADMDALPMQEENDIPYCSKTPGKAHMCGHDGHTAILLGAATLLSKKKPKNNIRFIFQPCEEQKPGGAPGMIQKGCLEGVDEIFGLHVWPWLKTGEIGICPGPMLAQSDSFDIIINGAGGHAAAPHNNIDPIVIGSQLVVMMQSIVSRMTNPLDPAVISVTRFEGGSAYNVIPSQVKLAGTVRTYSVRVLAEIKRSLQKMIEHTAEASGAQAILNYMDGYPPLINHESCCKTAERAAARFLDQTAIISPAEKAMFGEDFAYYVQQVPGCFIQLGCRNEAKKCIYPLHHPKFNLDEDCLKVGIRLFAELASSD